MVGLNYSVLKEYKAIFARCIEHILVIQSEGAAEVVVGMRGNEIGREHREYLMSVREVRNALSVLFHTFIIDAVAAYYEVTLILGSLVLCEVTEEELAVIVGAVCLIGDEPDLLLFLQAEEGLKELVRHAVSEYFKLIVGALSEYGAKI